MPSGFPSVALISGSLDKEIISAYTDEFLTLRNVANRFSLDRLIIKKILIRNGVEIRRTRKVRFSDCKLCSLCKTIKPFSDFHKKTYSSDNLSSQCRKCCAIKPSNPIHIKNWRKNNKDAIRAYDRKRNKELRKDPTFAISENIRISILSCVSAKRQKNSSTFKILGYTPTDLKSHIEGLFKDGMTWDNRNMWHIDHIKPVSSFAFDNENDIKEACALSNLQPLWASDNIKKSSWYKGIKYSPKKSQTTWTNLK